MEIFIKEKNLIEEKEWVKLISSMETNFDTLETNKERAKRALKKEIEKSLLERTKNLDRFGILFSGGVDSTLLAFLCKKNKLNFKCFTIGIENSQDVEYAKRIAEKYNLEFKYRILTLEEFESILKETIKILESKNFVSVSVGSVLLATIKLALQEDIKNSFWRNRN